MKNLLFDFNKLGPADAGVKKAVQQFGRAGSRVAQTEAVQGIKRTSGISYRELSLTFADSQRVVLRIKQSGDIWQVLLNGTVVPVRNQDDHVAAVAEIAKAMDAGRQKFQRRLAAIKVKPPAGIRTAAPKMEQVLTQRRDTLKEAIAEVREEIVRVRASNAAPAPAAAAVAPREAWQMPMGAWVEQQLATGRYAEKYAADPAARKQRADRLQVEWMEALVARSTQGRISDDSLDDLVDRMGEGALRMFRGTREPGVEGYRLPDLRAPAMDSATLDAAKLKGGFMAFKVDAFKRLTVFVKFESGMTEADARRDALTAAKAEMGGGAVRLLSDDGVRVSKVPEGAWEVDKAKGWAWIANRT